MTALLALQEGGARVPLDEALAWANLAFLALFAGVVPAILVLRRRVLRRRDLVLYGLLGLLLATLLAEYHVRRTAYAAERHAQQEYEITRRYADQVRVLDLGGGDWDPAAQAKHRWDEARAATTGRLLGVQSITTVLFALFCAGIALCALERPERAGLGRRGLVGTLAAAVVVSVLCALPLWRAVPDEPVSPLQSALISVGPGLAMAALGIALVREFRALASFYGVLLGMGAVLYGVLQLTEIGERLIALDGRGRELYRFGMLSLALGLRLATFAGIVMLPLVRDDRARIQRWMARVPGGAAVATLRADRVLEIRDPDDVTANLPLTAAPGRDGVYELDLRELEGAWGTRVTRPGAGSAEFLASPPESLALYRVLLIPLPARFLGGDHLLLTLEAESVVRLLPRARLGLVLLRAKKPEDRAGEMRVWWCNDHVGRLFGDAPAELWGRTLSSLVHPDWRQRLADVRRDDYSSVLAAVPGRSGESGDEPGGFVRITACPFGEPRLADDDPAEMLLMMVSSLSSDSHTHTDFLLHNLAHTLRTPIQLVRGALDRVLDDVGESAGPGVASKLRRARAEATRLEHAVDLNLHVGRDLIERGEEPERFAPAELVAGEVLAAYQGLPVAELAPVVRASRAKLRAFRAAAGGYVSFDAGPDVEVRAYRAPLKVMLRELVENALHYSRNGGAPPGVAIQAGDGNARDRVVVRIENEIEPGEVERHAAGLVRESQGLSCVRFLSVRYGHPFRIEIDRARGVCAATVEVRRVAAARPVEEIVE